jgi:hypothetical protein
VQTWGERLAVLAFALTLLAVFIGLSFAAGYILGRLIL